MADLTPPSASRDSPDGERGQLILIAAVVLAVSFIGIAVIVNSAIFTENVATRGDVPGSHEALDHRYELVQNTESVVEAVNRNHTDDPATAAQDALTALNRDDRLIQSRGGGVVDFQFNDTTDGTRIAQNVDSRNFTGPHTNPDWTAATGVEQVRAVEINVTDPAELSSGLDAYTLELNDSFDHLWNVSIADAGSGDVNIVVETPTDQASCTRSVGTDSFEIAVTDGTVGGEPCPALTRLSDGTELFFGTGINSTFDIEFQNATAIEGTYSLVIGQSGTQHTDLPEGSTAVEPYWTDALYSVTSDYSYHTTRVSYETVIRIAPGESPALSGEP